MKRFLKTVPFGYLGREVGHKVRALRMLCHGKRTRTGRKTAKGDKCRRGAKSVMWPPERGLI